MAVRYRPMTSKTARIAIVFGTRPEIIKLAELVRRYGTAAVLLNTFQLNTVSIGHPRAQGITGSEDQGAPSTCWGRPPARTRSRAPLTRSDSITGRLPLRGLPSFRFVGRVSEALLPHNQLRRT